MPPSELLQVLQDKEERGDDLTLHASTTLPDIKWCETKAGNTMEDAERCNADHQSFHHRLTIRVHGQCYGICRAVNCRSPELSPTTDHNQIRLHPPQTETSTDSLAEGEEVKSSQTNTPANQPPPEWVLDGLEAPVPPGCGRDADEEVQGEHHHEHHRAPPPEWDLDGLEAPVPLGAVGMSMKMFGKVRKLKYRT